MRQRHQLGRLALAVLVAGASALPALAQEATPSIYGVWRNPKNSVHVDIRPCGAASACGFVVWATEDAKADARKGGTPDLIGLQLFRNFTLEKDGGWRGKVFVPDINATFSGGARAVDATTLRARGCLIASIGCKSQTWRRVDGTAL